MAEFKVAVRDLCELVATQGSLDSRFLPAVSGIQGIAAQKRYQKRQPATVEREVTLSGCWTQGEDQLQIQGRVDGMLATQWLEEIKTIRVSVAQVPESARLLHWAQLQCYGYLWCEMHSQAQIELKLTYLDEKANCLEQLTQNYHHPESRDAIEAWFERYLNWSRIFQQLRRERNDSVLELAFPYLPFRPGQHRFSAAVYQTIRHQKQLLIEAPTGIGKTMAALYPATRLLGQSVDKVVYLTAKNSTQSLPLQALRALNQQGARLRAIVLTGKERACVNPGAACQSSCPYAQNFYAKLHQIDLQLLKETVLDAKALQIQAQRHTICPYYLAMLMAPWFDLIIADYNYALDSEGSMSWLTQAAGGNYVLLVDEAHNVMARARALYSAQLSHAVLRRLARETLPEVIAKRVRSLRQQFSKIVSAHKDLSGERVNIESPDALLRSMHRFTETIEQQLAQSLVPDDAVMSLYFELFRFLQRSELVDVHYGYQLLRQSHQERIKLACLDVAPELTKRFEKAYAVIFFSATLQPMDATARLLGLAPDHYQQCLPSPYPAQRQGVWILSDINTRYRARAASYVPLAEVIAANFYHRPANHLVFFPSFAYLQAVAERLPEDLPLLIQQPQMDDEAREQFVATLADVRTPQIGLAVLGGIFSEGIDLPGEQLESAMIVGVGLAQFNAENEAIREYFDAHDEDGYALHYLYPGMQRVIQAAGRVIRGSHDCGTIILADDRYLQPEYRQLLPVHWQLKTCRSAQLSDELRTFWQMIKIQNQNLSLSHSVPEQDPFRQP
ncbi:ATP-dependent DNA helicase [Celerinatantimonas sp. YJH-8]|uniref:ATP-dependent DNA helicase n=1 Tax=Celerinatantimonas sp. YJH-8 TaxID=3228714 RepID=UPI0038C717C3